MVFAKTALFAAIFATKLNQDFKIGQRMKNPWIKREAKKLIPPLHGALPKNDQDVHLFEKLAFLSRRERQ